MSATTATRQAEAAELSGAASVASAIGGYGGEGYVVLPARERDDPFDDQPVPPPPAVTFTIDVPADDWYTLTFRYANGGDADVYRDLLVDGEDIPGAVLFRELYAETDWSTTYDRLPLTAGTHSISLTSALGEGPFGTSAEDVAILVDWLQVREGVSPSNQISTRALVMNNWEDLVGIHESAQIDPADNELFGPYLSQLRYGANWQQNQIDFGTAWFREAPSAASGPDDGAGMAGDVYAPQFDTVLRFDENGIMHVDYGDYLPTGEPLPVSIEKAYAMVPGEPLLVERYTLTNTQPLGTGVMVWDLMETLALPPELVQQAVWDEQREAFIGRLDQGEGEAPLYMAFGAFREIDAHQVDARPAGLDLRDAVTLDVPGDDEQEGTPPAPGVGLGDISVARFAAGEALTDNARAEGNGLVLSMSETSCTGRSSRR